MWIFGEVRLLGLLDFMLDVMLVMCYRWFKFMKSFYELWIMLNMYGWEL